MKKSFDLNTLGAMELSREELVEINGGGWIANAWDWTTNAAKDVWDFLVRQVSGLSELV